MASVTLPLVNANDTPTWLSISTAAGNNVILPPGAEFRVQPFGPAINDEGFATEPFLQSREGQYQHFIVIKTPETLVWVKVPALSTITVMHGPLDLITS
jgi:hypothetical protein